MGELYKVIFTGQLRQGADKEEAIIQFMARFKAPEAKARKLMQATGDVVIKKGVEQDKAERFKEALEEIGLLVRVDPMQPPSGLDSLSLVPTDEETKAKTEGQPSATTEACPKCGSNNIEAGSCLDCGIVIAKFKAIQESLPPTPPPSQTDQPSSIESPSSPPLPNDQGNPYAAPQAEVFTHQHEDDRELTGPIGRPFSHGWQWITQGFWHFRQNPVVWILALIAWIVISMAAAFIPFIGQLASILFTPVILAGFMIGAHEQQQGGNFEFVHLFAGFSRGTGQLILVGVLYLVGMIAIGLAVMFMGGGMMFMAGMSADPATMEAAMFSGSIVLMVLIMFALMMPIMMAYWFAPALIVLGEVSAINAMKLSFMGCVKNILPFLLYGIVGMILMLIASIPFGLGLLVAIPMMTASIYTAYRDIYYN